MTTYPQIVLDEALEHDMFVVALSKEPKRQFEALSLEKQLLIKELVLKYCPSKFAEDCMKQAMELVQQFKFEDALKMMQDGAKKDKTVDLFNDFIKKLEGIVTIINDNKE